MRLLTGIVQNLDVPGEINGEAIRYTYIILCYVFICIFLYINGIYVNIKWMGIYGNMVNMDFLRNILHITLYRIHRNRIYKHT